MKWPQPGDLEIWQLLLSEKRGIFHVIFVETTWPEELSRLSQSSIRRTRNSGLWKATSWFTTSLPIQNFFQNIPFWLFTGTTVKAATASNVDLAARLAFLATLYVARHGGLFGVWRSTSTHHRDSTSCPLLSALAVRALSFSFFLFFLFVRAFNNQ